MTLNTNQKIRLENEITYFIECLPECIPVRGNAMASGDDTYDKEVEDKVLSELEWNEWVWCVVKVTAEWNGLASSNYLGECSYDNEEQFKIGGYFFDMKQEARNGLLTLIEATQI